ncbi:ATP-binding protein [Actinoplanes sp. NBRC 103695]|uniref:ATP-binding protein n=1 Tax=Actinoplanes sp. NBRC 103695 TaxID=3032202 RepID=UPI0024A0FE8B|nr:ATP-binding protein [Actinoplanes sp. NBRC 103695]GLY94497.1 ATPase [Actinoplanes sp. NBRC 103695]
MNTLPGLLARLADLEKRIRTAVGARRQRDPAPDDPFRGLYLSDEIIDALLEQNRDPAAVPWAGQPADEPSVLPAGLGLSALDIELLLVAVAPDVDSRFEQFYGYLNDDVTRRRATVGLALRLCGLPEGSAAGRSRLGADSPLVRNGLLIVEDPDRPLLTRTLRVPDPVVSHLLGDMRIDPALGPVLAAPVDPVAELPGADVVARALTSGARLLYLRERSGGSGPALGVTGLHALGRSALMVDAERLDQQPELVRPLLREALLTGAGVVVGPIGSGGRPPGGVLDAFSGTDAPLLVYGTTGWDPRWGHRPPLHLDAAPVPAAIRAAVWRSALDGKLAPGVDPAAATAHFTLGPPQIRRAAEAAVLAANADGELVDVKRLRQGARTQNAAGLERLARRIEPGVGWDDLVLPGPVLAQLGELAGRARHRERVLQEWRMRPGGGRGIGVVALFAGDSGTGKTMSAEVVAGSLGLDLYTVNLATVVDKYVGETEKNLERIFTEAAGVNGVLLFDEADAIFGKRSEVRDAHDRYANIESAYLLQRMESFDGVAILATNLRANLDDAFTRRLDAVIDFPVPDQEHRAALWDVCLGPGVPRADDIDLVFLSKAFELAGGHIRAAAVTAAYLAAADGRPVGMLDLIGAVAREYRKLGRLVLDREFGPYLSLVTA